MKIINDKPPIWKEAHEHFDIDDSATIYTWGDVIYNPAGIVIQREYIEHESVHSGQQRAIGGPEKWWEKYITDPAFRYNQEVEAYGRQHAYFCTQNSDRNKRYKHAHILATILSSPMYKIGVNFNEAFRAIRTQALLKYNFE